MLRLPCTSLFVMLRAYTSSTKFQAFWHHLSTNFAAYLSDASGNASLGLCSLEILTGALIRASCAGVPVVDINADGKPDLVVADFESCTVSLLLGNGDIFPEERPASP